MADGTVLLSATIAGIALHRVDNVHMIGLSVLRAGRTFVIPIEEDNIAGMRLIAVVWPKHAILKTLYG